MLAGTGAIRLLRHRVARLALSDAVARAVARQFLSRFIGGPTTADVDIRSGPLRRRRHLRWSGGAADPSQRTPGCREVVDTLLHVRASTPYGTARQTSHVTRCSGSRSVVGVDLPLLEEDFDSEGMIEPGRIVPDVKAPECAVFCSFGDVVADAVRPDARQVTVVSSEARLTPVWEIEVSGRRLAVLQPGVGAPQAAAFLEEVIAMGCTRIIACGGAGALTPDLVRGHAVVVDSAVRDEGTSFHYLPATRTIDADPQVVALMESTLKHEGIAHVVGRTWTTDAFYRETRSRADRRVAEGCVVVEMEAAALFAVARYREVTFGHLLMAGNSLAVEI